MDSQNSPDATPGAANSGNYYPTSYNGGDPQPTESTDATGTPWQHRMPDGLANIVDRVANDIAASDFPGAIALGLKIGIPACIAVTAVALLRLAI